MVDCEILIQIIPIVISIFSIYYTRTVDKREEKRYEGSLRKESRYDALLLTREITMILNKYSLEYDFIEINSRKFNKDIDERGLANFHIDNLPGVLAIKSKIEPVEDIDIYNYKNLINEFNQVEIEKLEKIFRLVGSIDEGKNDLKNKYNMILEDLGETVDLNTDIVRTYLKSFSIVRTGYSFLFKMIFEEEDDAYESVFQKVDHLSGITKDEDYHSIIFEYKLAKDKFLNHHEHLDKLSRRMEEINRREEE